MKKFILITLFGVCTSIFLTTIVVGVSPTSEPTKTASASASSEEKDVRQLREKIAQKVEEMKKDERAYTGILTKKQDKSLEILAVEGIVEKKYIINIDDTLTKLYKIVGVSKKEIKLSDIETGNYVIVLGQMLDNKIEADELLIDEQFMVRSGKISELSKSDYYYKVITFDKEEYTLDIQSLTKQFMMNLKTKEIEKTGFSKVKERDNIHFVVSKTNPGESKEDR